MASKHARFQPTQRSAATRLPSSMDVQATEDALRALFYELEPTSGGDVIALGLLDTLCRRINRPWRDGLERDRLMVELDPENAMHIRLDVFSAWFLQDQQNQQQQQQERYLASLVPVATPVWEQICESDGVRYFHNVATDETSWDRPPLVLDLLRYLQDQDEKRRLHGNPETDWITLSPVDMLEDLRKLFVHCDQDRSETLNTTEFRDLCGVVEEHPGTAAHELSEQLVVRMRQVDSFSIEVVVSWEALNVYWISNAPFQCCTKLGDPWSQWEQIEAWNERTRAVVYRHVTMQQERWNHPSMDDGIVALLLQLFPSSTVSWSQRIHLFFELQAKSQQTSNKTTLTNINASSRWTLGTCRSVLMQLGHECLWKAHVVAVISAITARFGESPQDSSSMEAAPPSELDESSVTRWFQHAIQRIEMGGWEPVVDQAFSKTYYYHEIQGVTQWDPPNCIRNWCRCWPSSKMAILQPSP